MLRMRLYYGKGIDSERADSTEEQRLMLGTLAAPSGTRRTKYTCFGNPHEHVREYVSPSAVASTQHIEFMFLFVIEPLLVCMTTAASAGCSRIHLPLLESPIWQGLSSRRSLVRPVSAAHTAAAHKLQFVTAS